MISSKYSIILKSDFRCVCYCEWLLNISLSTLIFAIDQPNSCSLVWLNYYISSSHMVWIAIFEIIIISAYISISTGWGWGALFGSIEVGQL